MNKQETKEHIEFVYSLLVMKPEVKKLIEGYEVEDLKDINVLDKQQMATFLFVAHTFLAFVNNEKVMAIVAEGVTIDDMLKVGKEELERLGLE